MQTSPSRLIPLLPFSYSVSTLTTSTPVKVLQGKSDRVSLLFSANFEQANILPGSNYALCTIAPGPWLDVQNGIVLSPETPTLQLLFKDVGSLVSAEWYAVTDTNGVRLTIIETSYSLSKRFKQRDKDE